MIFSRAITVNWDNINAERRKLLQASNNKENQSHPPWNYAPGDQVLIILDADERHGQLKMSKPTRGSFTVTAVHTNGTVDITRGRTTETITIRRIKPFHT
jgi:hypothetical protein